MARLTKENVLSTGLRTEEFPVPEWDGEILLGEWPIARSQQMMAMFKNADEATAQDPAIMVKLFVMGCIEPRFEEDDIPALMETSGAVIIRAAQRIMELNGLTQAAQDEARGKS